MWDKSSLKWCAFTLIAMTFLSLLPQTRLWLARGSEWQGAYATVDGDEFLYSAYVNALIDGRPRRNDPFSARNDNPKAPLPESTFSIQFIPSAVIASLARVSGITASTAFIILIAVAGLLASSAVFWLLLCVTGDNRVSAVGTIFVLCLGGVAAGEGLLGIFVKGDVTSLGLIFLRRYQPAASFFIFFVFCTLVWLALGQQNKPQARRYAVLAGAALGVLVFSYLYLWTAAAAWLACIALLWFYFRPHNRLSVLEVVEIVGGLVLLTLLPYLYLVLNRASTLDQTQTMISTHWPDPFRLPEIIGLIVVAILVIGIRRRRIEAQNEAVIFAGSLALLPLVLFNQQVLTGRSMQPFHFQNFIANYAVLTGFVIAVSLVMRPLSSRLLLIVTAVSLSWGVLEVDLAAQARAQSDIVNDKMVPVLRRLKALSSEDGTLSGLRSEGKAPVFVFSPHIEVLRFMPTWTAQGTAIGLGSLDFGSASTDDRKVYAYLYYSGIDIMRLKELLHDRTDDRFLNYYTRSAVFGHERVLAALSLHPKPIGDSEIDEQMRAYETYATTFSKEEALKHPISYVILLSESGFDFSHIDRWYERRNPERIGPYDLYRVKLRP